MQEISENFYFKDLLKFNDGQKSIYRVSLIQILLGIVALLVKGIKWNSLDEFKNYSCEGSLTTLAALILISNILKLGLFHLAQSL